MSVTGLSHEVTPPILRHRVKDILYVHRNRPIVPLQAAEQIERNGPALKSGGVGPAIDSRHESLLNPACQPWPDTLAKTSGELSKSSSTNTFQSLFPREKAVITESSRRNSKASIFCSGDESVLSHIEDASTNTFHGEPKNIYFCHHCPLNFDLKENWVSHEYNYHERLFEYHCLRCANIFVTEHAFKTHFRQIHEYGNFTNFRSLLRKVNSNRKRTAWGCGICSALLLDWTSRCEHVAAHCEAETGRNCWSHSRVIIALLRQPVFDAAWQLYLIERHGNYPGPHFGLQWRVSDTKRSFDGNLQLQDWLEMGDQQQNTHFVIKLAYDLGHRFVAVRGTPGLPDVMLSPTANNSETASSIDSIVEANLSHSESMLSHSEALLFHSLSTTPAKSVETPFDDVQGLPARYINNRGHSNQADAYKSCPVPQLDISRHGNSGSASSKKRQRRSRTPGEGGEDGEESQKHPVNCNEINGTAEAQKLACPYYQRDPRFVKHRACEGPGWPSVHRVKEHIYRDHKMPIRCSRCGISFKVEEDLQVHYRRSDICHVVALESFQGIDKKQEAILRSRKKSKDQSESDRWRSMYTVLFPDDEEDLIPSPYYDISQSAETCRRREATQIERYMRRELAPLVREELSRRVPSDGQLMEELEPIIQECQKKLFRLYRQTKDKPTMTTPTEEETNILAVPVTNFSTLDNFSSDSGSFIDLSRPLPPLPTEDVSTNGVSFGLRMDSNSESDCMAASMQTSSRDASIDERQYDNQLIDPRFDSVMYDTFLDSMLAGDMATNFV